MLEDVSEEAYRVDRILLHLYQADLVGRAKAVIFGDFSYADSKEEIRILGVLKRFAEATNIPVFYAPFFGHGKENILWKYASAQIKAGVLSQ